MRPTSNRVRTLLLISLAVLACGVILFSSGATAKPPEGKGGGKGGGNGGGGEQPLANPAFVYSDSFDRSLHLISSDGLERQQLTKTKGKQGDRAPAWSPDLDDSADGYQGQIAFLRYPDQGKIWCDLYTIRPDGTGLTYIRSFDDFENVPSRSFSGLITLSWAPDGSRIVYESGLGVWAVDAAGNLIHLLDVRDFVNEVDSLAVGSPDFSPDMDPAPGYQGLLAFRAVYSSESQPGVWEEERDIWTLDIELDVSGGITTGAVQNLTNGAYINPSRPKWSPDGTAMAFHNFDATADVVVVDFITGQSSVVFTKQYDGPDTTISWSPDGEYLGFDDHDYAGTDSRDLFYVSAWDPSSPVVNVTRTAHLLGETDVAWYPAWVNDIDP